MLYTLTKWYSAPLHRTHIFPRINTYPSFFQHTKTYRYSNGNYEHWKKKNIQRLNIVVTGMIRLSYLLSRLKSVLKFLYTLNHRKFRIPKTWPSYMFDIIVTLSNIIEIKQPHIVRLQKIWVIKTWSIFLPKRKKKGRKSYVKKNSR